MMLNIILIVFSIKTRLGPDPVIGIYNLMDILHTNQTTFPSSRFEIRDLVYMIWFIPNPSKSKSWTYKMLSVG